MKFTSAILAFAASLSFVSAQDLSGIPTCALACFAAAIPSSGCTLTDTKCQCTTGQQSIANSVAQCVPGKCSADDQAKVLQASQDICAKAGVTVSITAVSATGSATGVASNSTVKATGSTATTTAASTTASGASQSTGAAGEVRGNIVGIGAAILGAAVLGF